MNEQSNLPKKKYHLLRTLKKKSIPKRIIPSISSIVAQFFIIKNDGKKLMRDLKNGLFLVGKLVFRNKFKEIKE